MGRLLRSSVRSDRATPQGCIMEHSTGLGDTTPTGYLIGLVRIRMGEASGCVSLGCEHILLSASLGLLSVSGIKILTESISGEERDLRGFQGIVHQRS